MRDKCKHMLAELSKYKHTDKEALFLQHVSTRLNDSFNSYQEELDQGIAYLKRRNELNVVRKLNRLK